MEGSGTVWNRGAGSTFPLNARNAWTPAEAMEVGFEMEGLAPGQPYKVKIAIDINDDNTDEPSSEYVTVRLRMASNAAIFADLGEYSLTVSDDEPPPSLVFTNGGGSVAEGLGTMAVVQLSHPSAFEIRFSLKSVAGTANPGYDYSLPGTSFTLSPGQTTMSIALGTKQDAIDEDVETVAIDELKARRERLDAYQSKARFAVADSYDRATRQASEVQPGIAPIGDEAAPREVRP